LKEWTTPDSRNTPSTTNLEEEEIVNAPGSDGSASMPEQVKRPNPWRKMMMMMMMMFQCILERTDALKNEFLEQITFVLAYLTVIPCNLRGGRERNRVRIASGVFRN